MNMIAPGVLRVPTRGDRDNCFLITDEDGLTLVDAGWKTAPPIIQQAIGDQGHTLGDIRRIVITHAHPDHVRGLAELTARTRAEVVIHELDAGWLAVGRVPRDGRSGTLGRAIDRLPLLHWQPVIPDRAVSDGETIGTLRAIHTPGHSPGHLAFLHEPSRALLVGDAVFHRSGLTTGPDALAADPATRNASYTKLPRDITAVGFSHGTPLTGEAVAGFITWLDTPRPGEAGQQRPPVPSR
jgi:glyoxylase-like metal-dependent hydrolase (beta-lactamase superfamily II)